MNFFILVLISFLLTAVFILDIRRKIDLTHKSVMPVLLIAIPHSVIIQYFLTEFTMPENSPGIYRIWLSAIYCLFAIYLWFKVNTKPIVRSDIQNIRVKILISGRRLVLYSVYAAFIQIGIYILLGYIPKDYVVPKFIFNFDMVLAIISIFLLYLNGMLRILITSRRINVFKKIIIVATMIIPLVQIPIIIYVCSCSRDEYEHECYRVVNRNMRIDSAVCKTKYPLVMVHGLGFKDLKYINYWGRIPKELIRNGAAVYYGNQEALGSVEYNAQDIKNKILEIIDQTRCEKVNIIAHSKGGLDARYMIDKLDMGDYVASLTCIGVPNKGSEIIDFLYYIPKVIFENAGKLVNRYFRLIGDKNPDFFNATRQLSTRYSKIFNEIVKDSDKVYYQSYATHMGHPFSDYILTISYIIIKIMAGDNDGLVTVESAKWGEFRGVLSNKYRRGISHGDIIDLRKDQYKGFDVREFYVHMVSELKDKGF